MAEIGYYQNPGWTEGNAGTFAIIIGVSAYDHLVGGKGPIARDSYDLSQLTVSSITAYRFFDWLKHEYHAEDAPLAKCWLLLSPTSEELEYLPMMVADFDEAKNKATYSNCRDAIVLWQRSMESLPKLGSEKSKAIFFFVGHGLEIVSEKQILLPSDYLKPPAENINDAISTSNLVNGLSGLKVLDQVLIIDACRNDHTRLRGRGVIGNSILNEPTTELKNPDVSVAILNASSPGGQAFMPATLSKQRDISLFSAELLEGLRAKPNLAITKHDDGKKTVNIYPLTTFLTERLGKRYKEFQIPTRRPVRLGGCSSDFSVTEILRESVVYTVPGIERDQGTRGASRRSKPSIDQTFRKPKTRVDESNRIRLSTIVNSGTFYTFDQLSRLLQLQEQTQPLWILSPIQEEFTNYSLCRAIISIPSRLDSSVILSFEADEGRQKHYCLLPNLQFEQEASGRLKIDIEITAEYREVASPVVSIAANLSIRNDRIFSKAAKLWYTYQQSGLPVALERIKKEASSLLHDKYRSHLAALIAATILLRERKPEVYIGSHKEIWEAGKWLRNLSEIYYPQSPDAAVLCAEQYFRDNDTEKALETLLRLLSLPYPMLSDSYGYALVRAEQLLHNEMAAYKKQELTRLYEKLTYLSSHLQGEGLFTTFVFDENLDSAPFGFW